MSHERLPLAERNKLIGQQLRAERALARARTVQRLANEKRRKQGRDVTLGAPVDPKAPL